MAKYYAAIDLKSFYASVECCRRGKDALKTNLVVADASRTDKTICLAISPAMKRYGLPGRARLFEVINKVKEINYERRKHAPGYEFKGSSFNAGELAAHPELALDCIVAPPHMQLYLNTSKKIYEIYLRFVAPCDIFAYSIDEVFCDISSYLKMGGHKHTPKDFVREMMRAVYQETGITATAGIGTNLYLAKVAMDIIAKHAPADKHGARLALLNEKTFREILWSHEPLTDFWRIGPGTARKLKEHRMRTLGDVARCSLTREELLFKLFGVNAELLIDHSWGVEPTEIRDIKNYQPSSRSLSAGQVLSRPYGFQEARTIVKEMAEGLALELTEKNLETDLLTLQLVTDRKATIRGTYRLGEKSFSARELREGFVKLYERIMNQKTNVKRVTLGVGELTVPGKVMQLSLFRKPKQRQVSADLQFAVLKIREKYGKNAILTGSDFEEGATGRERHKQIGGHRA